MRDDGRRQFELLSLFGDMDDADIIESRPKMSVAEALSTLSKLPREAMVFIEMPSSSTNSGPKDFVNEPVD
jgi:hypothetical protein